MRKEMSESVVCPYIIGVWFLFGSVKPMRFWWFYLKSSEGAQELSGKVRGVLRESLHGQWESTIH